MKPARFRLLGGLVLGILFTGCASSKQAKHQRGMESPFSASFETTWQATIDALYTNGLTLLRTNLTLGGGSIRAERGLNLTSFGENVLIHVTPVSSNETRVGIRSLQKGPLVWPKNWESPILASIRRELGPEAARLAGPAPIGAESGFISIPNAGGAPDQPASQTGASRGPLSSSALEQRRGELSAVRTLRAEELRSETDPGRRERLQAELEYLDTELRGIDNRLLRARE